MRLVCVNGSPHGAGGGTARIAEWLLDACRAEGVAVTTFQLRELDVRRCLGCGRCMSSGTCAISDDVPRIHAAWGSADLVVLCSPTHVFQITDWMKSFIDRTAGHFHRPPLAGKYAAVVTSSAGMGESAVVRYLSNCLEVLGAAFVGAVWGTYRPPTRLWDPERIEARAHRLGHELVACARERRDIPASDEVIAQRRFLAELIWRNRKIFKADYAYWQERGWFDALPGTRPADAGPADGSTQARSRHGG
jgi:multimeric flavodoxin WrbA